VWLSQRVKWSIQYHLAFGKVFELSYLRKAWALRLSLGFSNLRPSPSHLKAMYKAQFCLAFWGLALLTWQPEAKLCTSLPMSHCKLKNTR